MIYVIKIVCKKILNFDDRNDSKKKLNSIQLFFEPSRIVSEHLFFSSFFIIFHCKQTRCQRNNFFYLNFFCFCSIIFNSYVFLLFLLYFVENRTVPIRTVSNGYWILDQNGTVHWTEPLKKTRSGYSPLSIYYNWCHICSIY